MLLAGVVGENVSAISAEKTARSNADSALASDISALSATVTNPTTGLPSKATASDITTALANSGFATAQSVSTLDAKVGGNYSAVNTVAKAIADGDTANSLETSTLQHGIGSPFSVINSAKKKRELDGIWQRP